MNDKIRTELLAMAAADDRARIDAPATGSEVVKPVMADPTLGALRRTHNARLARILDEIGWPGIDAVGEDGAEAAWRLAMFASDDVALQQRCLQMMEDQVDEGELPAWQPAFLLDRLLMQEGKEQIYGSQLVASADGAAFAPWPIQDPDGLEARRIVIGAPTLEESLRSVRGTAR